MIINNRRAFLVIFRLCRSDIFATQKRYCRFAAVILYSPPKLGEAQYHLRSKYNWRSQYSSSKANITEKNGNRITITVLFWRRRRDSNPCDTFMPYEISSHASSTSLSTPPCELGYYISQLIKNQGFSVPESFFTISSTCSICFWMPS